MYGCFKCRPLCVILCCSVNTLFFYCVLFVPCFPVYACTLVSFQLLFIRKEVGYSTERRCRGGCQSWQLQMVEGCVYTLCCERREGSYVFCLRPSIPVAYKQNLHDASAAFSSRVQVTRTLMDFNSSRVLDDEVEQTVTSSDMLQSWSERGEAVAPLSATPAAGHHGQGQNILTPIFGTFSGVNL